MGFGARSDAVYRFPGPDDPPSSSVVRTVDDHAKPFSVLFVCTGNICRSPTALGVLRTLVGRAGLEDRIAMDSAGLSGFHVGEPPDPRARAAAGRRGYPIDDLRARRFSVRDFHSFDLILAMDRGHLQDLIRLGPPDARDRTRLFLSFAPELNREDVPDPYYGDDADFDAVLDMVEAAAAGLLVALRDGQMTRLAAAM